MTNEARLRCLKQEEEDYIINEGVRIILALGHFLRAIRVSNFHGTYHGWHNYAKSNLPYFKN